MARITQAHTNDPTEMKHPVRAHSLIVSSAKMHAPNLNDLHKIRSFNIYFIFGRCC